VPLFLIGTLILLCAAITVSIAAAAIGAVCMIGALAAQGGSPARVRDASALRRPRGFRQPLLRGAVGDVSALRPVRHVLSQPHGRPRPTTSRRRFEIFRLLRPS